MIGNKKVLLTGATGFIGSHIAESLLKKGYSVIATKRNQSNLDRCLIFCDQIEWVNIDKDDWDEEIKKYLPNILIHAAWEGVNATDRNNWDLQLKNFQFSMKLFNIAIESGVEKIISLGSQAEYGVFSQKISENYIPNPADAYGATKIHTSNYLRLVCQQKNIQWNWLRVFSVFGPGENESWLLPQVIKNLMNGNKIELTKGEQMYDYMFIHDFTKNLLFVVEKDDINCSGIFNFCSGEAIQLKDFLLKLPIILNVSSDLLLFGSMPYRALQSMHMEGDLTNYKKAFGNNYTTNLNQALIETVNYYKRK